MSELGASSLLSPSRGGSGSSLRTPVTSLSSTELVEALQAKVVELTSLFSLQAPHFLTHAEVLEDLGNEIVSRWRKTTSLTLSQLHTLSLIHI